MYDWEIHNYLQNHNYNLNQNEYSFICNTCPQLNHIKYEPFKNKFKAWSDGGEYFEFNVYYENKESKYDYMD